jgi:hypothetical protein
MRLKFVSQVFKVVGKLIIGDSLAVEYTKVTMGHLKIEMQSAVEALEKGLAAGRS